jgi:hypothetical protein
MCYKIHLDLKQYEKALEILTGFNSVVSLDLVEKYFEEAL